MSALAGVLVLGTLYGLLAAIGQSVLGLVYRSSKVAVDTMGRIKGEKAAWGSLANHPERTAVDGVLVLRLDSPIFWVNAADVRDRVLAAVDLAPGTRALILDLESTNQLDTSSADMLGHLLDDLRARDIDLHLVRVFHFVRQVLERSGFEERLGPGHIWHSISQGVRAAQAVTAAADEVETEVDEVERIAVHHEPLGPSGPRRARAVAAPPASRRARASASTTTTGDSARPAPPWGAGRGVGPWRCEQARPGQRPKPRPPPCRSPLRSSARSEPCRWLSAATTVGPVTVTAVVPRTVASCRRRPTR